MRESSPSPTDILRSLRLLRSEEADDRKRGITILSALVDDARVLQVFEYLYQHDPEPAVRDMAWRAINHQGPSIPRPVPEPPAPPVPQMEQQQPSRALYVLQPRHAGLVAKQLRQRPPKRRLSFALIGLLLLSVGLLWGLVLPYLASWYEYRQNGVTAPRAQVYDLQQRGNKYYVLYRFSPHSASDATGEEGAGPLYYGEQRISRETFRAMAPDTFEPVVYLPDDPSQSYLKNRPNPDVVRGEQITLAAMVLTALLLILLLIGGIRGWRRGGKRVIKGQIVSCTSHVDQDGDLNIKFRYRFRSPSGDMITGLISQIRTDLKNKALPDEGTPVAVFYRSDKSHTLL